MGILELHFGRNYQLNVKEVLSCSFTKVFTTYMIVLTELTKPLNNADHGESFFI
jgi:hypothetical protein